MALKLRVISDHYKALGKRSSQLFGVTGGRIGRAQDNDWILPDPDRYVSSHHAKVSFRAGEWVLEDTSTNGVFINGSDTPASVEGPYSLKDGDRLRLGDYEILVSIDERNDFPSDASGQLPAPKRIRKPQPNVGEDLGEELDITDLLSESAIRPVPAGMKAASEMFDLSRMLTVEAPAEAKSTPKPAPPTLSAATSPATTVKPVKPRSGFASLLDSADEGNQRTVAQAKKNDDWQMQTRPYDRKTMSVLPNTALARTEKTEPEKPRRPLGDSLSVESSSGLEAFCRGAGIDPSNLPGDAQNAMLTLAGQMLREVVLGLMESLKGRADLKNRLRLSQTTIQPAENNPLKFSPSVDEAVLRLLDPHSSRYLGPIEAIRDSFADLRNHQIALNAAIQAAIDELMSRIEPGDLQEKFDRGLKRGSLLGAANKMKYWDLYVEFYQTLNQRNEQGLPVLFAEELARTYAERAAQKKR
ncbi:MAG TPA: type VI secretion system-associated FHA domain protein TagH [Steroidobacteraceae bacterium]|nr:type VI secretion system-associated FHA domain protein TagH [Steroidobacteraceae bacterium]